MDTNVQAPWLACSVLKYVETRGTFLQIALVCKYFKTHTSIIRIFRRFLKILLYPSLNINNLDWMMIYSCIHMR